MIRFRVTSKKGDRILLGFGLSEENIQRLRGGDPIHFDLRDLGFEQTEVLILYGKTEEEMRKNIDSNGLKEYIQ